MWETNDTPERIAGFLIEEARELQIAINEAFITGDVFSVASEIGDLQYLIIKLSQMLGIDPLQASEMKLIRNSYKYPDHISSNGRDYESAVGVMKNSWRAFGGDSAFSHVYLDYLAHDE